MADEFDEDVEQDFDDFEEDENQEEVEFDEEDQEFEEGSDDFDDNSDFEDDQEDYDDSDSEDFDKPVAEGDTVELEIEDLGSKGDGIARVEGFVVFVPGGEVGESYDVEITSVGRKFAFGEIE